MNKFYHLEFLKDVRYFFAISIISLIISFNNQNVLYLLPLISLFGSVMLAFHAYFLIFSRNYSEYLEKKINKQSNSEIFITHKLENSYFFPIQDKKIVVAKIGKEFSWFSFVTLFITFYGVALYVYAVCLFRDFFTAALYGQRVHSKLFSPCVDFVCSFNVFLLKLL